MFEQDGLRDQYVFWQNGAGAFDIQALQRGQDDLVDDPIRSFWQTTIRPDGKNLKTVRIERGFTSPDGQDLPEDRAPNAMEFFAIAQVASELSPATLFPNQVTTKLVGALI